MQSCTQPLSLRAAKDQKEHSTLVRMFCLRREMMKINVLQFLEFRDIAKFSATCKHLKSIVDPCSCDHMRSTLTSTRDRALLDTNAVPTPQNYMHLKRIAALQLLDNGEHCPRAQIDLIFRINIREVSDFQYLDGAHFKNEVRRILDEKPQLEGCMQNRNKQNVEMAWNVIVQGQSILNCEGKVRNPLQGLI